MQRTTSELQPCRKAVKNLSYVDYQIFVNNQKTPILLRVYIKVKKSEL